MYHKGEVEVMLAGELTAQEEEEIYTAGKVPIYHDARALPTESSLPRKVAVLPHSCGHWIIGGYDEIRQLMLDLRDILETMVPSTPSKRLNLEDEP